MTAASAKPYPLALLAGSGAIAGAVVAATLAADPYGNPDAFAFVSVARGLLAGRGFSYVEPLLPAMTFHAYRAPGYPAFLAPALAIGGVTAALALQGALAGVTAAMVGALAARAAGRGAGLLAFVLSMAWWPAWWMAGSLLSETLYAFLAVAAVAAASRVGDGAMRWAALAGGLASLAALTRSIGAALAAAIAVWLVRRPRALAAFALAGLLVWAPWPLRNAARLHAFVPFTTNAAMNFFDGNSPVTTGECWDAMVANASLGELGFERYFAARARDEVLASPGSFARQLARKAFQYALPVHRDATALLHRALLPLALIGLVFFPGVRSTMVLPGLFWFGQAAVNVLTVTNARYRFPSDWVIVLGAALALDAVRARGGPRAAVLTGTVALVLAGASLALQSLVR